MATCIGLAESRHAKDVTHHCVMEDDGYYWFIYPHFESFGLESVFDLYGGGRLGPSEMDRVLSCLAEARADAVTRAASWDVVTGTDVSDRSNPVELTDSVARHEVLSRIDALASLARQAKEQGSKWIVGDGD